MTTPRAWTEDGNLTHVAIPSGQLHALMLFVDTLGVRQILQFGDGYDDFATNPAGRLVLAFSTLREAHGSDMV